MQLHLMSNGKKLGSVDVQPEMELRLRAYGKVNKTSLMGMIDKAIRHAIAPESCPVLQWHECSA